jgi:hypothetical protein
MDQNTYRFIFILNFVFFAQSNSSCLNNGKTKQCLINSFVTCVSTHNGLEIHDRLSSAGYVIVRK